MTAQRKRQKAKAAGLIKKSNLEKQKERPVLEKVKVKVFKEYWAFEYMEYAICPRCKHSVDEYKDMWICHNCKQALDWGWKE